MSQFITRMAIAMTRKSIAIQMQTSNISIGVFALCFIALSIPQSVYAGGVCVVAKELGNSLAVEWIADTKESVESATEKAKASLRSNGFNKRKLLDLHVQASTQLAHGYMVIIQTKYTTPFKTNMGNSRTSYGCGFSNASSADAEQKAVSNLGTYSWGWKSEFGYELHARHEF